LNEGLVTCDLVIFFNLGPNNFCYSYCTKQTCD